MKIKEKVLYHSRIDELDFTLQEQFRFDDENDEFFDVDTDKKSRLDATQLPIEVIEGWIDIAKSRGSTHVKFEFNEDQYGYEFEGVKLELCEE